LKKYHSTETVPYIPRAFPDYGLRDRMTERGRKAKGFYLTPFWVHKVGAETTSRMLLRAHVDAVVVDIKNDVGQVLYPSKIPMTRGLQRHLIKDPRKLVATFHRHGIYVIARLVAFKDSRLPFKRPDLAIRTGPRARRLFSAGARWLDQYSAEAQDYIIDLALEAKYFGFDEVQLDYIRFPKGRGPKFATWLHQDKRPRAQLIADFLERMDRALQLPLSADTYGLTTLVDGDPRRLGQTLEMIGQYVEAISPMMYANGMGSYFRERKVTPFVYNLIHCGLWRARQKVPHVVLRPYLQSYPNKVESFFGPKFIKQQVRWAERAGSNGFIFWNSTMRNRAALVGLRQLGKKYLDAYGDNPNQYQLARNTPGDWCPAKGIIWNSSHNGDGKRRARSRAHRLRRNVRASVDPGVLGGAARPSRSTEAKSSTER
jgi:hypothetical protein